MLNRLAVPNSNLHPQLVNSLGRLHTAGVCPEAELGYVHSAVEHLAVVNPRLGLLEFLTQGPLGHARRFAHFTQQHGDVLVVGGVLGSFGHAAIIPGIGLDTKTVSANDTCVQPSPAPCWSDAPTATVGDELAHAAREVPDRMARKTVGDVSTRWFGWLVAYVVPGFLVLWGASHQSSGLARWLQGVNESGPGMGGVLYALVVSVGLGMTASLLRWLVVDHTLQWSGVKRPAMDESKLSQHLEAFDYQVDHHYRYYQFYGNTFIAGIAAYGFARAEYAFSLWTDLGLLFLAAAFVAGARDALVNYYAGIEQILGAAQAEVPMTNGKHPKHSVSSRPDPLDPTKHPAKAAQESKAAKVASEAGSQPKDAASSKHPKP